MIACSQEGKALKYEWSPRKCSGVGSSTGLTCAAFASCIAGVGISLRKWECNSLTIAHGEVHQFRIIVRHSPIWFVFADISECYCPPIPSLSSQLIYLFQMIFAVDIVRIAIAGEAEPSKSESQSFPAYYFIMNCQLESSRGGARKYGGNFRKRGENRI